MSQWVVVAHLVVEAETPEQAITLVTDEFVARFPEADGWHHDGDVTPRYTITAAERLPDAAAMPPRQPE